MPPPGTPPPRSPGRFSTTHWSLIVAAGEPDSESTRKALTALCETYWQPIYVYLRRRGIDREEALDLTQGFFARLLEKNYVGDAQQEKGRFRTFLLTSLNHYTANEWDRQRAQKRGGGKAPLSLDAQDAERAYLAEPAHHETPERVFDRRWAGTLLETSLRRLREESTDARTGVRLERLLPLVSGDDDAGYESTAEALGMERSAVRVAVHRLRRRLRALLRDEVARTVEDPSQVDEELRHLFAVLGP